jgi:hypothetical protein
LKNIPSFPLTLTLSPKKEREENLIILGYYPIFQSEKHRVEVERLVHACPPLPLGGSGLR